MPALQVLGRQFSLGSDDLPIPAMLGVALRACMVATLALSAGALSSAVQDKDALVCDADEGSVEELVRLLERAHLYCAGMSTVFAATCAVFVVLFVHSLRGTIVDDEKRRFVVPLLQVLVVLVAAEGCLNAVGSVTVFRHAPDCVGHSGVAGSFVAARLVALATWTNFVLFFTCGWLTVSNRRVTVDTAGGYSRMEEEEAADEASLGNGIDFVHHASDDEGMSWSVTRTDWEQRCRRMCNVFQLCTCNLFGSTVHETSDETYRNVANVMARFFKGMDVVPSDLIAALCLLRAEQRSIETKAVQAIIRNQLEPSLHSSLEGRADRGDGLAPSVTSSPLAPQRSTAPTTPGLSLPFGSAESFRAWLWEGSEAEARARRRMRVQHFETSHVALNEEAKTVLADAAHFSPFMLGIYGKLLFTYMNLVTGPCQLVCPGGKPAEAGSGGLSGGARERSSSFSSTIMADDCCSLNYSALQINLSKRLRSAVVFANFSNKLHESPYCIAVEHETRCVVLAIRGTLSAADMLIDAIVTPRSLTPAAERWGFQGLVAEDSHAHGGMLKTAESIRKDVDKHGILAALLSGAGAANRTYGTAADSAHGSSDAHSGAGLHEEGDGVFVPADLARLPNCAGYRLKVIGHSLGAGVASILSLMLKPVYPDLRVLAYSPPGCIFDFAMAERSAAWIDSIFVGNDLVPHSSWRSLLKLRGQMLECLRRSKVNKPKAMRSAITNTHADDLMYPADQVPNTFARQQLALKIQRLQAQAEGNDFLSRTPMFAPGRLLHIMRTETIGGSCCTSSTDVYLPVWVGDRHALEEFVISRRMALDHFPNVVADVLESVAREHCELRDGALRTMMVV